jgi:predicted nucleic acid-binding protein
MIYLLDVNALVALGFLNHEFHGRMAAWIRAKNYPELASCSISELGFVRVLAQAHAYGFTVAPGSHAFAAAEAGTQVSSFVLTR